jgi:UDP-galactopyranose mutase
MLFTSMADGIDTWLNCDYTHHREALRKTAARIVYTGSLDTYYDYCYGVLPYRTLSFTYEQATDHQQAAMVLYPQKAIPFTRSVDYGILFPEQQNTTVIGKAYPQEWNEASGMERMYPIDDTDSAAMYAQYVQRAKADGLLYTGRLARYQYMNMDQVIASARTLVDHILRGG